MNHSFLIPIYLSKISAGFPSPAADYKEEKISLDKELIKNPSSTFFVRVSGDSMKDLGIHPGDTLIVDKSIEAKNNKIVIAVIEGEFTVKKLKIENELAYLVAANSDYEPILINKKSVTIWGVVTHAIKKF